MSPSRSDTSPAPNVLDLIDKGVKIANVPGALTELARNGIAAQMMGFTGFPTETTAEAQETYEFLNQHSDLWTTAGLGVFTLTPGSIVAKQPDRFGIELLPTSRSDDIQRYLPWRERGSDTTHWPETQDSRILDEHRLWVKPPMYARPFAGGIDSAHSLLYYARYGRELLPPAAPDIDPPRVRLVDEPVVTVPFSSIEALPNAEDLRRELVRRNRSDLDTTWRAFLAWLDEPGEGQLGVSNVLVLDFGQQIELPAGLDLSADSAANRALRAMVTARART